MKSEEIIRGWKDEEFRLSLSSAEQALLPKDPAALAELTDDEMLGVDAGTGISIIASVISALTLGSLVSLTIDSYFHSGRHWYC